MKVPYTKFWNKTNMIGAQPEPKPEPKPDMKPEEDVYDASTLTLKDIAPDEADNDLGSEKEVTDPPKAKEGFDNDDRTPSMGSYDQIKHSLDKMIKGIQNIYLSLIKCK